LTDQQVATYRAVALRLVHVAAMDKLDGYIMACDAEFWDRFGVRSSSNTLINVGISPSLAGKYNKQPM
jgi:hypothetical protein